MKIRSWSRVLGALHRHHGTPRRIRAAVASSPSAAAVYARDVLKARWPVAETTIMPYPRWAYLYALDVIKGPWPEAEAAIATDPVWAWAYARYVMKRPWPEAEDVIAKDYVIARAYARDVLNYPSRQRLSRLQRKPHRR